MAVWPAIIGIQHATDLIKKQFFSQPVLPARVDGEGGCCQRLQVRKLSLLPADLSMHASSLDAMMLRMFRSCSQRTLLSIRNNCSTVQVLLPTSCTAACIDRSAQAYCTHTAL
jgi:hypothetical protein